MVTPASHRVVIIGGGFGGLNAAQRLRKVPVSVTLLDRRNYHLFQPLLYQIATGGLSPANIASPLREILKRQHNTSVLLAEATGFDLANRRVLLDEGVLEYDSLIVASGAQNFYFGHDDWEQLAPSLKTIEDATEMRARILYAFEAAEREPEHRECWQTFVIVGGGPTGVELAGSVAEIAHRTLRKDFRHIDPAESKIILVEGGDRVLPPFVPELSAKAKASLERLGVEVRTNTRVVDIQPDGVEVCSGDVKSRISTRTVLWAAGVKASSLGEKLAYAAGVKVDRGGRVVVEPDLSIPGHPEVFAIGDLANFCQDGQSLPGLAPVAIQQGRYVAKLIAARLKGQSLPPFRYRDLGVMATIGRRAAVVDIRGLRFSGFLAWLVWLFLHLMQLVGFQNRLLVFTQWAFNYFTRNRSALLITGEGLPKVKDQARECAPTHV